MQTLNELSKKKAFLSGSIVGLKRSTARLEEELARVDLEILLNVEKLLKDAKQ